MTHAIRKHLGDFAAIIGLILVSVLVASVILSNQRLTLPGWVPVLGQSFYTLTGEFSTAQAVTPGQGQTVNVAGVEVGEIARVELRDGKAVLGLRLDDKNVHVYKGKNEKEQLKALGLVRLDNGKLAEAVDK